MDEASRLRHPPQQQEHLVLAQGNATNTAGAPPRDYPVIDAVCLEIKRVLRAMEPPAEVCSHFRNARIEVLKGIRTLIDHRIECLSDSQQAGRKITVE